MLGRGGRRDASAELVKVGATGFEPATFRPPAERIHVSMCLGASVVSYVSRGVNDLDRWDGTSGAKAVLRR